MTPSSGLGYGRSQTLRPGDVVGFEAIYDQYARRAYVFALQICRSPELAEDAVQQAFLDVWRAADRYDPTKGSVSGWIFGIVRNRSIGVLRRQAVRRRHIDEAGSEALEEIQGAHDVLAHVCERTDAEQVRQALLDLPDNQREVVGLAYYGGLSQAEIASGLNVPLGTVKGRMRLGLERLRHSVQSVAPDSPPGLA